MLGDLPDQRLAVRRPASSRAARSSGRRRRPRRSSLQPVGPSPADRPAGARRVQRRARRRRPARAGSTASRPARSRCRTRRQVLQRTRLLVQLGCNTASSLDPYRRCPSCAVSCCDECSLSPGARYDVCDIRGTPFVAAVVMSAAAMLLMPEAISEPTSRGRPPRRHRLAADRQRRRQPAAGRMAPSQQPPPAQAAASRAPAGTRAHTAHRHRSTVHVTGFWSWALLDRRTGQLTGSANASGPRPTPRR